MLASQKIRVGVLRGGPSPEYGVSLETGKTVLANLPEEHYSPIDIFISRNGVWHEGGVAKDHAAVLSKVDVVFNALHGKYGEDGEVQKVLEEFRLPYTGSRPLSSALGMNKILSKRTYRNHGLKTPFSLDLALNDLTRQKILDVFFGMPAPFVVKPATAGSSIGVRIVSTRPELEEAVVAAFEYSPRVLVEEFIKGKEVFAGAVEGFRATPLYPLFPVSDGILSSAEREQAQQIALSAHNILGLSGYSSSDLIVHPTRGIFILETDTLPSLKKDSKFTHSLKEVGSSISDFLHHVVQGALGKK